MWSCLIWVTGYRLRTRDSGWTLLDSSVLARAGLDRKKRSSWRSECCTSSLILAEGGSSQILPFMIGKIHRTNASFPLLLLVSAARLTWGFTWKRRPIFDSVFRNLCPALRCRSQRFALVLAPLALFLQIFPETIYEEMLLSLFLSACQTHPLAWWTWRKFPCLLLSSHVTASRTSFPYNSYFYFILLTFSLLCSASPVKKRTLIVN